MVTCHLKLIINPSHEILVLIHNYQILIDLYYICNYMSYDVHQVLKTHFLNITISLLKSRKLYLMVLCFKLLFKQYQEMFFLVKYLQVS